MDPGVEPEPLAQRPQGQELADATTLTDTRGTRILAGGGWHALERFVPQFYTLAISVIAARYLGPSDMGRQSYIAFVSLAAVALLSSSLWVALVRHIGEALGQGNAGAVRDLLAWAWRIELGAAALGGGALVATGLAGATPRSAWYLAGGVTAAAILQTVPSAILVGLQQFRQASVVGLTTGLLGTAATAGVLAAGGGIAGMFAVEVAIGLVNLAWTSMIARRALAMVAPVPAPAGELKRRVLRYAAGYSAGVVLELIVVRRSELFFLDRSSTNAQIAYYSIAYAVVTGVGMVPFAFAAAAGPVFATLFGAGSFDRIARGFNRAIRLMVLFTLPLTAIGLAVGPEVIRQLYGSAYGATAAPLLILLAGYPLRGLTPLANTITTAFGRLRLPVGANWLAAGIDIGVAAALVPSLGARGAAIANVTAQVVYAVPLLVYAGRLAGRERLDASLLRAALASAGAGAAAWATLHATGGVLGCALGLLAFVAAFAILAAVLRILPARDAEWIEEAVEARLGPRARRACHVCAARG